VFEIAFYVRYQSWPGKGWRGGVWGWRRSRKEVAINIVPWRLDI